MGGEGGVEGGAEAGGGAGDLGGGEPKPLGGAREGGRIVYRLPRNGAVDSLNEPGWVYRPLEPQNAIACTFV